MEDAAIVALYLRRSEEAIARTQEAYGPYLSKVSYNILLDLQDSQECVNDTYLAAWDSIPPHTPAHLLPYLSKITRQLSIDRLRRRQSAKRAGEQYALSLSELEECVCTGTGPEEMLDGKLLEEAIGRFLESLPPKERNLFLGRYFFFDPLKDAAAYCGMSEAKAKTILFRTRQKLKAYLQKEGFIL